MSDIKSTKGDTDERTIQPADLANRPSCRICLRGEGKRNSLIRVCKCRSHFELVHAKCIENWIQLTNNERCEICGHMFRFTKYSMSYSDFVRLECEDNTNFVSFLIITLLVAYVLSIGFALAYICYRNVSVLIGTLLFFFSIGFLTIFVLFLFGKFASELRAFLRWKFNHYYVRVKKY